MGDAPQTIASQREQLVRPVPADLIVQLTSALEPFAEKADYADALEAADDDYLECAPLLAGDYRKARELLDSLKGSR